MAEPLTSAFGILFNPHTRHVLLQKRDGCAPVNPQKWGLFGGLGENQEAPAEALRRELHEELGVVLEQSALVPLWDYVTGRGVHRFVFGVPSQLTKEEMRLGEGEDFGWFSLEGAFRLDLTESTRLDLHRFEATIVAEIASRDHGHV